MTDENVLLSSIVEREEVGAGFRSVSFSLSGEPQAAAIVNAVNDAYPRAEIDWDALVGKKVTFLRGGESAFGAGSIVVAEATIFAQRGGHAWLPKGKRTKGYMVQPEKVLDVVEGFGGRQVLAGRVAEVRSRFPELAKLTKADLEALPRPYWAEGDEPVGDPSETRVCQLAVFGRWSVGGGDYTTHEALWLVDSYLPEEDIAEGVCYVPESVGCSESGSMYGQHLLSAGGKVLGFQPVSFKQAVHWTNRPHADVLAEVVAAARQEVTA